MHELWNLMADEQIAQLYSDAVSQQDHEALKALLEYCETRKPRTDGIPAILILEDFYAPEQKTRKAAPGDEQLGSMWAPMAATLSALVEQSGGNPDYPSICPAMSALAESAFRVAPYQDMREDIGHD